MRRSACLVSIVLAGVLATAAWAEFQPIPADGLTAIVTQVVGAAEKDTAAPIAVKADAEKAAGLYNRGKGGLIVVPQKNLKEGDFTGVSDETGAPIAYLFLSKLGVAIDGKPFAGKLFTTSIPVQNGANREIAVLRLSVKKENDTDWNLYVFGSDKKPIAKCAFREEAKETKDAISIDVKDFTDDKGKLIVTVHGKYAADIPLTIVK